jgi:hypothetical protein
MTDLLSPSFACYFRAARRVEAIRQEGDRNVTLVSDGAPNRRADGDLVLLDDGAIGHAGSWEIASISGQKLSDNWREVHRGEYGM